MYDDFIYPDYPEYYDPMAEALEKELEEHHVWDEDGDNHFESRFDHTANTEE